MQAVDYYDSYYMERTHLSFFGMYPEKYSKAPFWKMVRKTLFLLSVHIHIIQILMNSLYQSFGESAFSVVWVTEIGFLLKLLTFLQHSETVLHFENMLNQQIFKNIPKNGLNSVKKSIELAKIFTKTNIVLVLLFVGYIAYYVPLVIQSGERHLPSEARVPCSLDNDFCYVGFFIFHSTNCIMTATMNTIFDCLFCKLTTICCCLLKVVYVNLEEMNYGDGEASLREIRYNANLHIEVLKLITIVDKIFNKIAFFQCLASIFSICSSLLRLTTVPLNSMEFFGIFNYFVIMFMQISVFCCFGNNIIVKSDQISQACYMSNWYESHIAVRKILFIMMERTKRPFIVTAGGFFTLSLPTLVSILKSAYSFWRVFSE